MAVRNLFCDQTGCGQVAAAFGFAQGATKTKACSDHALSLSSQGVLLFDIAVHQFVETEGDGSLMLQRQGLRGKGLENVSVLEVRCDRDLEVAQLRLQRAHTTVLDVVERSFREMQQRIGQRYQEVKQFLASKRYELERLVEDKHFQLSSENSALCESLPAGPLLGFALGDCRLAVAEVLFAHFSLFPAMEQVCLKGGEAVAKLAAENAAAGNMDIAQEVAEHAEETKELYTQAAQRYREKHTQKLLLLIPTAATEAEVTEVAGKYVRKSQAARETGNYDKALKQAQKAKAWLQQWTLERPEVLLQLGLAWPHFGKWQDADIELRRGLALQPAPILATQLCNAIAEVYFQAGLLEETAKVCEWTLQTWGSASLPFELFYALYFLVKSLNRMQKRDQGNAAVEKWTAKIVADSLLSQFVFVFIRAEQIVPENEEDRMRLFEAGLKLGTLLPHSLLTACVRVGLGFTYGELGEKEQAKLEYMTACQIFQSHFPHALEYGKTLLVLGALYVDQVVPPVQAEQYFLKAVDIMSEQVPRSLELAVCLYGLGCLYEEALEQPEQAELRLQSACDICTAHFPKSLCLALCLERLSSISVSGGRLAEAVERLIGAMKSYDENHHPTGGRNCREVLQTLHIYFPT